MTRSGLKSSRIGRTKLLHDVEVALVAGARRQGDVHRRAQGPGSAVLVGKARPGIEGAAVLVQRDEEHVRIVPVDVLGAVAVVAVGVDDGDALAAVVLADVFDHHRLDVDVAKAALPCTTFMAWWPGGRTRAKARRVSRSITSRAAWMAPPAEMRCDRCRRHPPRGSRNGPA